MRGNFQRPNTCRVKQMASADNEQPAVLALVRAGLGQVEHFYIIKESSLSY